MSRGIDTELFSPEYASPAHQSPLGSGLRHRIRRQAQPGEKRAAAGGDRAVADPSGNDQVSLSHRRATVPNTGGSAALWSGQRCPASCAEKIWRALTLPWTPSCSPPPPTRLATWCWRRWLRACRRSLRARAARSTWFARARTASWRAAPTTLRDALWNGHGLPSVWRKCGRERANRRSDSRGMRCGRKCIGVMKSALGAVPR